MYPLNKAQLVCVGVVLFDCFFIYNRYIIFQCVFVV